MATKRSVSTDLAGYARQHGPHSQFECIAANGGANTKLDCDDPFPNNEPDIAVNPAAPGHMIASSNDYGTCCDEFYTTLDNATTWTNGNMSRNNPQQTGSDPVTVFDSKHGTAIHSSLNYSFQSSTGEACRGDVVTSVSEDGGITWLPPVVVESGVGCDLSTLQLFNDKEWIVTDNTPSSPFYGDIPDVDEVHLARASSARRLESVRRRRHALDGAQEISGRTGPVHVQGPAGQCDEDQASVPTVGQDGTVYVAFRTSRPALWGRATSSRTSTAREVDERGPDMVEPDVRGRDGGRLDRLPDQRRRPPDADRLPGSRVGCREHRRESDRREALPRVQ
jgi:hypothetical protein